MQSDTDDWNPDEPVAMPITGELDLHAFQAREVSSLLPEYFAECRDHEILAVRVIHGKGSGTLRQGVHHLLENLREQQVVESWTWPAGAQSGGWGATWVCLRPKAEAPQS